MKGIQGVDSLPYGTTPIRGLTMLVVPENMEMEVENGVVTERGEGPQQQNWGRDPTWCKYSILGDPQMQKYFTF